jgi:hypothetical protein
MIVLVALFAALAATPCESAIAAGPRAHAVAVCSDALQREHTNANVRGLVRALVAGAESPTTTELAQALTIAANERAKAPWEPTLAATTCDIAESLGDGVMLETCESELRRIAPPNDAETAHVAALLEARCPPARFWTGWAAILLGLAVTLVRALRRRGTGMRRAALVTAAALLGTALLVSPARAAEAGEAQTQPQPHGGWLSKWAIDDAHPDAAIPTEKARNADPMEFGYWLQDLALKAERASARGDHAGAARFYEALATAVPERAVGYARACDEYEALGDRAKAAERCGAALLHDGLTVKDYAHFVHLVLAKRGPLDEREVAALGQVLGHMKDDPAGKAAEPELSCEVGVRTGDLERLEACSTTLLASSPSDPRSIAYRWALAVRRGDWREASSLVNEAQSGGVGAEGVEAMRQVTAAGSAHHSKSVGLGVLAVLLFVAAGGVAARRPARGLTPVTLE